jgi:hypothetical protein
MKRKFSRDNRDIWIRGATPRGGLPFAIDAKGGEIEQSMETEREKHADMGRNCHRGSMGVSVAINAKGGDC